MFTYPRFRIRDSDRFNAADFPMLETNIPFAKEAFNKLPSIYRTEILISFLKDHCFRSEWVFANPALCDMIRSKVLPLDDLEALFASGKDNKAFIIDLEQYIEEEFAVGE